MALANRLKDGEIGTHTFSGILISYLMDNFGQPRCFQALTNAFAKQGAPALTTAEEAEIQNIFNTFDALNNGDQIRHMLRIDTYAGNYLNDIITQAEWEDWIGIT